MPYKSRCLGFSFKPLADGEYCQQILIAASRKSEIESILRQAFGNAPAPVDLVPSGTGYRLCSRLDDHVLFALFPHIPEIRADTDRVYSNKLLNADLYIRDPEELDRVRQGFDHELFAALDATALETEQDILRHPEYLPPRIGPWIVLGENHRAPASRAGLIAAMEALKAAGVDTLGMEFLVSQHQVLLDDYLEHNLSLSGLGLLNGYLRYLEAHFGGDGPSHRDVVIAARQAGFRRIIALDTEVAGRCKGEDLRTKIFDVIAVEQILTRSHAGGVVLLVGEDHLPGISKMLKARPVSYQSPDIVKALQSATAAP